MKTSMRFLSTLAAPAALALLALTACQTATESGPTSFNTLAAEQEAALRAASDSLGIPRPPREVACATLRAHLATLDSTAPNFAGLSRAVARVCELLPPPERDTTRVRPDSAVRAARCDSLTALLASMDRTDPRFGAVARRKAVACGELPPKPPRPDTVRPDTGRPDSTRPDSTMRAARCDSLTAALAAADSSDPGYQGLANRTAVACGERPPESRPSAARPEDPEDEDPEDEEPVEGA